MTTQINSLNPQYTKVNGKDSQQIFMIKNYDQRKYQNRNRPNSKDSCKIEGQHIEVEVSMDKIIEQDHVMLITIKLTLVETILEKHKVIEVNILEVDTEGRSRSRDRQYSDNFRRNNRCSSSRCRSGWRASTDRDRTRCYKCREYDHFAKNCPTLQTEKGSEQIQQMYNMDEEQTALKVLVTYT